VASDITVILSTGEENVDATYTNKQRSKVVIIRDVMTCSNAIVLEETAASIFRVEDERSIFSATFVASTSRYIPEKNCNLKTFEN